MPSKRAFRLIALVVVLFAVGYAAAAERGVTPRTPLRHDLSLQAPASQSAGPASPVRIMRLRVLELLRLVRELNAQPEPQSFGTNGLSDGPDPIDATEPPGNTGAARKQEGQGGSLPVGAIPGEENAFGPR